MNMLLQRPPKLKQRERDLGRRSLSDLRVILGRLHNVNFGRAESDRSTGTNSSRSSKFDENKDQTAQQPLNMCTHEDTYSSLREMNNK